MHRTWSNKKAGGSPAFFVSRSRWAAAFTRLSSGGELGELLIRQVPRKESLQRVLHHRRHLSLRDLRSLRLHRRSLLRLPIHAVPEHLNRPRPRLIVRGCDSDTLPDALLAVGAVHLE